MEREAQRDALKMGLALDDESVWLRRLYILLLASYAWQLHSFWLAVALYFFMSIGIFISTITVLGLADPDAKNPYRWVTINRRLWFIGAWTGLAISGASFGP